MKFIQSILGMPFIPRITLPPEVNTQDRDEQKRQRAAEKKRERSLRIAAQRHGRPFRAQTTVARVSPKSNRLREIESSTGESHAGHRVPTAHAH